MSCIASVAVDVDDVQWRCTQSVGQQHTQQSSHTGIRHNMEISERGRQQDRQDTRARHHR